MTNREWLNNMALIDLLMALDFCPNAPTYCINHNVKCYRCRMQWLKEKHISDLWNRKGE